MEEVWKKTLSYIEQRVDPHSFNLWFAPITFRRFKNNRLFVSVPDQLFIDWVEDHYPDLIPSALEHLNKKDWEVKFEVNPTPGTDNTKSSYVVNKSKFSSSKANRRKLNRNYTFDNFIVGNSNQFAHAASLAVAENSSRVYNPLYIYGGSGLGKTHLLNAIGNLHLTNNPETKLAYISAETFVNELISSIRYEKTTEFRNKYRSIDILLIDDIQFIAGKERTQEEFFHTFNALYESGKQIVISSDCSPKNIPTIEDRLRSRFEWGLIADIQIPDLETKIAILKKKAEKQNFYFPDDVCLLIASNIHSNIRELEGSMTRVIAHSSITGQKVTLEVAKEVLKHIIVEKERRITVENIQKAVAAFYKIRVSEMKSKSRLSVYAVPRQVAMYLCRELTKQSLPAIGTQFGGKDHTTVLHACNKIKKQIEHDSSLKAKISHLNDLIQKGPPV
jgi:chromosomal replication initiator protein